MNDFEGTSNGASEAIANKDKLPELEKVLSTFETFKKSIAVDTEKYINQRLKTECDKIYQICEPAVEKRLETKISEMQRNQEIQKATIDALLNRVISLENQEIQKAAIDALLN